VLTYFVILCSVTVVVLYITFIVLLLILSVLYEIQQK